MYPGTFIYAPEGFRQLEKDTEYCFLNTKNELGRVLLLEFSGSCVRDTPVEGKEKAFSNPHASLHVLQRDEFEEALLFGQICECSRQRRLPPWLELYEGLDFNELEKRNKKTSLLERARHRELIISPLVERWHELVDRENLVRDINSFARNCKPAQNGIRVQEWLFIYLAFGRNVWALCPTFYRSGTWSRENRILPKKLGAPSEKGKQHGHNAVHLKPRIIEAYSARAGLGKTMQSIYVDAMVKDFGCLTKNKIVQGKKVKSPYNPKGDPFPSESQFSYHVISHFGLEAIQTALYGYQRTRNTKLADKGRFSESFSNLMEDIEIDGYYLKEIPKGLGGDYSMPPICVVRGVCRTSGYRVGIGFSFGAEAESAYRMMLFSMAIPKVRFGELFGVKISAEDWMVEGLPLSISIDRGPGAALDFSEEVEQIIPGFAIVPSYSGQSKATSESSHPRSVKTEGQPTHFQSNLNHIELAKREVIRLVADNSASNIDERLTLEMKAEGVLPTPNGMWEYLAQRGRSDAYPISFEDAVRSFLTPKEFTLTKSGAEFHKIRFNSDALKVTGVLDKVARSHTVKVTGYILDFSLRYAWLEIGGYLVEVQALLPILDDEQQLFLSLSELELIDKQERTTRAYFHDHAIAARMESQINFTDSTGKGWLAGTRKKGRAPSRKSRRGQSSSEVQKYLGGKKHG